MNAAASLLRDLVRLPSVNPMGRAPKADICFEHRMTAYLEAFFKNLGVPYERHTISPGRDNIIARFLAPGATRTIMFEAHQDTIPVDNMTIEPFAAHIEGDRLYGRGSCDIKGGMTAMLTAFARLVEERPAQACNVIMACTVDEEHTFLGVQDLVKRRIQADFAVVAEPTKLDIVHAHKGVVRWFLTTRGRACHSSSPERGESAIYHMGRVLAGIERYAQILSKSVIDPLLGPATISVGMIEGGSSVNTVPDRCAIEIDRRVVGNEQPHESPRLLLEYLRNVEGIEATIEQSACWIAERALLPVGSDEVIARLGRAVDSVRGSHSVRAVPFGTDAASISFAGTPAVVFGPGDIAQAHTCDEWLSLEELDKAAEILYLLATQG